MKIQRNVMPNPNRVFTFSVMLFVTLRLADQIMVYRQVQIFGLTLVAGVFIMPLYYYVNDVIAELFGYKVARNAFYYVLCCGVIFSIIIILLNKLPEPKTWGLANQYNEVLGRLLRSNLAAFLILPISTLLNAKILTKWKRMTQGRYFWLRSLGASAIAEAIQTILGCLLLYTGVMPFRDILSLMLSLYVVQLGCGVIIATPGLFIVNILKRIVGDSSEPELFNNPFAKKSA